MIDEHADGPPTPPPTDSAVMVLVRVLLRIAGVVIGTVIAIAGLLLVVCYGIERFGLLR
jgi:hypothetical protein